MTAWELIGFDGPGRVRIVGGRTLYESVWFNDSTPGEKVGLGRLDAASGRLRAIVRYVDADTELELVPEA